MTLWQWLVSWLIWLSADPVAADLEVPRAAAAVAVARASMVAEATPAPTPPAPTECDCGKTCVRGVWKPDGRVEQRCACQCTRCVAERSKTTVVGGTTCTTGTCRAKSSAVR